jgi:succinoglycan biosynthesis transport protein ExoP
MTESGPQAEAQESYLAILRRSAPIVLITTVIVAGAGYAISLGQSHEYEASAEVFVASSGVHTSIGNLPILSTDPDRVLATQAQVAQTPAVARLAAKAADLPEVTPSSLLASTSVVADSGQDILTFSATDANGDTAQKMVNAYAQAYIDYRHRLDTKVFRDAKRNVDAQIAALQKSGGPGAKAIPSLTAKSERLSTQAVLAGSNATLGQPATSATQIQPRPARNAFLGGVLGIILGIGLVFLRDALNTRVRSAAEVEERLGIPLIGRIPPPPKRLSEANGLSVLTEPHTPQSEAYRMLATNIELMNLERGASSIMICSPVHSEGKSTTAANLGVAFARRGLHVTLLDADLRRPMLKKLFHVEDGPGLVDAVVGRVSLEEALVRVELPDEEAISANGAGDAGGKLELLAGGPMPPSPAEFLKSKKVSETIARLSERSDLVLIDTPPLLPVSDALTLMLSANIDCAIIGARLGSVRRQALTETRRILDTAPVVKLGFFATGTQTRDGYAGGYGYYYASHGGERDAVESKA